MGDPSIPHPQFAEFQLECATKAPRPEDFDVPPEGVAKLWYALGLAGEAGEIANHIKKGILHGHGVDPLVVKEELGDCLWYISELARLYGINLEDVARGNVAKCEKRYPDGFSHEASRERTE